MYDKEYYQRNREKMRASQQKYRERLRKEKGIKPKLTLEEKIQKGREASRQRYWSKREEILEKHRMKLNTDPGFREKNRLRAKLWKAKNR
jgi:hypothetical protein